MAAKVARGGARTMGPGESLGARTEREWSGQPFERGLRKRQR